MAATVTGSSLSRVSPSATQSSFTVALSLLSTPSGQTSSAPAQTFTVQVGNGDHKFKPDVIQAEIGDFVQFDFYPVNHSVIRAEYGHPCIPYEMTGKGKVGFWSGFHAVDAVLDNPPKYTIRVNDSAPTFFYCSAPDSCTKQGMVGVINPNSTTSLSYQRQLALQASYQLSPGETFPSEAETPSSSTLPNGTALQPPPNNKDSSNLSPGAIAGIVIACASVLVLGFLLAFFWGRLRALKDEIRRKNSTVVRSTEPRSTWFLTSSSPMSETVWQNPHTQPSPPYSAHTASSPMSSHAVPPAYYETQYGRAPGGSPMPRDVGLGSSGGDASTSRVSRATSHRSTGGMFDWSPAMGYYMRTHSSTGAEQYTVNPMRTSDMTSPVDPDIIAPNAVGQVGDLQRAVRMPDEREGYIDEKGMLVGRHVNRADPAEMPDTSVQDERRS